MARVSEAELEQLKAEISVERLALAAGVKLKPSGKDLLGRCPFHDDRTPSLVITPDRNIWHCLGECQAGGSVIDWVMKAEGVSFRHAVELLRERYSPSLVASAPKKGRQQGAVPARSTTTKLSTLGEGSEDDQVLLQRVTRYYTEQLKQSPEALSYLEKRGLMHPELIEHFQLGYSDRSLGYRLPHKNRQEGAALRERLTALGIYRKSGHEHFRGSLVIPVFDEHGQVVEMYGRKINEHLRAGTPKHLYLPGPHEGIFNRYALGASEDVVLCESLIDALTFWCAGFRNVTTSYGVEGFTDELKQALVSHGVQRVLIAYDRDEAGDKAAEKVSVELEKLGIGTARVKFPKGMDANEYARRVGPAEKSLGAALRGAEWMRGPGQAELGRETEETQAAALPEPPPAESVREPDPTPVVVEEPTAPVPAQQPAPIPSLAAQDEPTPKPSGASDELTFSFGDRSWRVRGLSKNKTPGILKLNLLVRREGAGFHVDTLELYSARHRAAYLKLAAEELTCEERILKSDLGALLLKLEELQEKSGEPEQDESRAPQMTEKDKAQALELLRDPRLLDRILEDYERCGVVGERENKLTGYLAATSRKLERPLAVVVQSSSAAGKSSLMDAVLNFMPVEERVSYSAMTGQSLFYMGETNLSHRILAIAEEEGAERASYALKLLQSEGQLTIASTGKDPTTGRLITQEYRVEGPVMLFLTTTAIEVDEELMNRCLVLTVDEGREQTHAIHERQRLAKTIGGLIAGQERGALMELHQNAQRLLRPLLVANPYAPQLTFPDHQTRMRRDHMKYLGLIETIALLHQYQREVKTATHRGASISYIEVEKSDIEMANALCREVLGRCVDDLPAQTRKLLLRLDALATSECARQGIARCDFRFTRRQLRGAVAWSDTQLRVHLGRLVELELVLVHRGRQGQSYTYELCWQKEQDGGAYLPGLVDVSQLKDATMISTSRGGRDDFAGGVRGESGPDAGEVRSEEKTVSELETAASDAGPPTAPETTPWAKKNGSVVRSRSLSLVASEAPARRAEA